MKKAAKKKADVSTLNTQAGVPAIPTDVIVGHVPLMEKLYLTLTEASQLSGLSEAYLTAHIASGDLKITKDDVDKIRRSDLKKL